MIDRISLSLDIARRIASGELSETIGAIAILEFAHECGTERVTSMSDAIMRAVRAPAKEAA